MRSSFVRSTSVIGALVLTVCSWAQVTTVLTYNIRYENQHDGANKWAFRQNALIGFLKENAPTVFGLQEALNTQMDSITPKLIGYAWYGIGRDDGKGSGEMAPIFYRTDRYDLLATSTTWISPTPDRPGFGWDATCNRVITMVVLFDRALGDSLWVLNTHWDHEGKEARHNASRMMREMTSGPLARGRRVLLLGDLNATARQEPVRALRTSFVDAGAKKKCRRGTFNGFKRCPWFPRRIDFIWFAPLGQPLIDYRVLRPKVNGRQVSDHYPVLATFQ